MNPFRKAAATIAAAFVCAAPHSALAEPDMVLTFGLGAQVAPGYFGSDDYEVGPGFAFRVNYLRLGGRRFGSPDPYHEPEGLGLRGSFRYVADRTAGEYPELAGLNDVDDALELGIGLGWEQPIYRVFGDVRYGVIGHEAFVGEIGADVKFRPSDRLLVTFGPRAQFGSDDYAATYFGVTPAESLASGLPTYSASGGMVSAGLELGLRYRLNENWGVEGALTWNRLTDDAASSPITGLGSEDQYGAKVVLTRRVSFDF
ncbi:hypothetical protein DEA8626_00591 [Defluviimonas aquaemixtae]|uniref:MltA-interacting protein n=1 Tax=Albidovulum aquaemixtae TaxID=1542388 RepID=A0A2R8B3A0_9RHOB|nr:MipA/OmpV family protein [Defluviimonas aquaemixtae]SPH17077.1 hypothetical protein DEA8626_00591 [Defluviimonas aquaemixtae]